jgi:DNA segregation ATPase FtsK/SpoIIIE, S-DNA-T family
MAPNHKTGKSSNSRKVKTTTEKVNIVKEHGAVQDEIILVIALVVSILLLLSNFNLCGSAGKLISGMIFGLVGGITYIIPFIIFFATAFYISNIGNRKAGRKIISALVFFIALAALIQMFVNPSTDTKILDYYMSSYKSRNGGGIIGGLIAWILCKLFAEVATYIILIAVMIIAAIVITGKAILTYLANKGKSSIKESWEYRKEMRAEQKRITVEDNLSDAARKPAKTFLINQTNPTTLKESDIFNQGEVLSVRNNNQTPTITNYEEELRLKFGEKETYNEETEIEPEDTDPTKSKSRPEVKSRQKTTDSKVDNVEDLSISQTPQQKEYIFPPTSLLMQPKPKLNKGGSQDKDLKETAMKLQSTLESFGVHVTITNVSVGPAVTRYELQPEQGVKVSRITSLADDIKLNLAASDIRIEAPIPGKAAVGIEVPNKENSMVTFRELIESKVFTEHSANLAFAVGKDIGGQTVITDIAKMPHLLIAGATGSGKSVCINTLIMSILYKSKPADVRMIMIDPKVVELNVYNGIPHLLIPVVTDPKKASAALNWAVVEMIDRYKKFADVGARDLKGYNEKIAGVAYLNDENYQKLPQIVIIIDELADLMMVAPGEVEDAICRLAQLARAAGIHLIIATQRPSVNVITGLIKANIPSRVAFAVSSAIDSRTIIDGSGAEKLLGKGDMLFFPSGYPKPVRIQGAFISDKEVSSVVDFLKKNNNEAVYSDDIHDKINNAKAGEMSLQGAGDNGRDEYFAEAGKFIIEKDKASIGMLQRVYKIGFNRAARIMDQLSEAGVVGPEEGTKPRKILMSPEQFEQYLDEY